MKKRLQNIRWSPLTALVLPGALLLAIDGSTGAVEASSPSELLPELPLASVNAANRIDGLTVEERDDGSTILRLKGTRKPTFNVYRLSDPDRLVVDISGSERGKAVPHVPLDTWSVGRVTLDSVSEKGAKLARIVLNLKRDASYIVVPSGKDLVVTVTPREVPPEAYFARKSAGKRKAEIDELKRQAEAYSAAAEKRASQANVRAEEAEKRAKSTEKKVAAAEKRYNEAQAKVRSAETARRMSARQRRKLEEAKKELEQAKQKLKAETAAMKKELALARSARDAAKKEAGATRSKMERELAAMKARNEKDLEAQRKAFEAEVAKLRKESASEAAAKRKAADAEIAKLRKKSASEVEAERKAAKAEIARLRKESASEAEAMKKAAEAEIARLRKESASEAAERRKAFEAEIARLRKESTSEAEAKRKAAEAEVARLRKESASEAEARRKAAEAEVARLRKESASEAEAKRKAAEAEVARLRKKSLSDVAARKKAAEAEKRLAELTKKEAEAKRKEAARLLADAKEAMAAAEAEKKQASKSRAEAQKALAEAKKARKGAKRKRKEELSRAVAQAEAAEKAAKARQRKAEQNLGKIKKDREALEKTLSDQAARSKALAKRIDSKRSELAKLEHRVDEARAKVDALGGAVTQTEVDEAHAEAKKHAATAMVLGKEVERLRKEAAAAKVRADAAQAKVKKVESKRVKVRKDKLEEARRLAAKERKKADAAAKQLRDRETRLARVSTELAGKRAEAKALESKLENLATQSASLKRKNKAARGELSKAEAELAAVQGNLQKENTRLAQLQSQVKNAQAKLDKTLAEADRRRASLEASWEKERKAAGTATVKDVRFEDSPNESRVIIELDGPMEWAGSNITPRMKLLKLEGAKIPKQLERSLDASAYKGPVGTITSFREGDDVKLIVATQTDTKAVLEEKPGHLIWKFPRKKTNKGKPEVVSLAGSKVGGFASPPRAMANGSAYGKRNKWRGERIDIELQDAPIKDVLLLFSDIGRVNIIAGQGVSGRVTMRLTSVPWDQALDIILKSLGLGMVQEGNVIRVATLQDLEEERRKAIERANAQVQLKPLETRLVPLSYATVGDMIPKVQTVLSSRGSVTPDSRTNMLIIMDVAENIALAEQLVNSLDSQTPQVLIEARIVEARTNWLRQLGIQWGFDYTASAGTGNPTGLLFPNSLGVAGGSGDANPDVRGLLLPPAALGNPNYAVDLPAPVGSGAGGALGFTFGSISGNLNTNLRLSAAEDEGEVRLISAPKIVTLDNNQAQIEQGVQIPISQVSAQGVNTRYVNATLALRVTPHVTNEGSVMLDVQVQKNEADFINTGARGDPTILTKQAQSQMLIIDGDTAVIGGIYTRNQSVNRKKVPWLADIPVIGWFFKNKSEADTRTELLIFLTPKIVNRASSIGGGGQG